MLIVNLSELPKRADVLLAEANNQYSRAALAKLFDLQTIKIGSKIIKPGDKIQPGDSFEADIFPLQQPAADIELPVIFENEFVVVVDKPAGVISHARGRYWDESSVASFIRAKITDPNGERAGIVHRLDRATSGVMICAKDSKTMSFLQKQFSNRKVKKKYLAVVEGQVDPAHAIISVPIARNPKKPKSFMPSSEGKPSETEYKLTSQKNGLSFLELSPKTGRTHQLRVHLKYINHPIVGDELYGGKPAVRMYLHANSLEITLPGGERKIFESACPWEGEKVT